MLPPQLFITGTDTDVGKTVISSILVKGLEASYWKPIQSGLYPQTDTEFVRKSVELEDSFFHPEAYRLKAPLSPHLSAKLQGVNIEIEKIKVPNSEKIIIEGAGGVLVPLNEKQFMVDLIHQLGIPVLIVARSTLGTINHTLLTLKLLRKYDISLVGVVLNGPKNKENREAIEKYGEIKVFEAEPLDSFTPGSLKNAFEQIFKQ